MAEYTREITQSVRRQAVRFSMLPSVLGLTAAGAGSALAAHHPAVPTVMTIMFVIGSAAFFAWLQTGLLMRPVLLPLIGLARWAGWITFKELDILVLAVAAGGYARMAWPCSGGNGRGPKRQHAQRPSGLVRLVL